MPENLLRYETSPYLLQHKDNPVHWMPWSDKALRRASAEGKPILLSIGYAACHWCHVMEHESFENPVIAGLMNELFVSIKVDREERPDLDTIYQSALALLGQQGGWPLTMFLTPKGEPFWGGTYFPPEPRYGRPSFPQILRGISATYRQEPEKVVQNVKALQDALSRLPTNQRGGGDIPAELLDRIAERLVREVDPVHGGIGTAPKFPQESVFELLWRAYLRLPRMPFKAAVVNTLTRMCQGGIYDHLGGGFARYSTDQEWLAPHFEKMLYDNAFLIDLLTMVWQGTGERLFETRVRETVDWLEREMIAEGGGFASTLDADSEGVEGRFYVWSEAEIRRLLGTGADRFAQIYDVSSHGNWEETNILNRRHSLALLSEMEEAQLAEWRAILFCERETRIRPGWDDKVLADWNGMMIAALANAGFVFDERGWIERAETAFRFVQDQMMVDGRLHHAWRQGQLRNAGTLDDHAHMARAALALFEVTGEQPYLDQAQALVELLDRHFLDDKGGGYFFTADDAENLIVRTKNAHDSAVPSGNGIMVGVLAKLFHLTGEPNYRARAEEQIAAFSGELQQNFFPLATLLNASELLGGAVQIVIVGERDAADTKILLDVVRHHPIPDRLLTLLRPDASLPQGHPAAGKTQSNGRATAYVCKGPTCSPPVTEALALAALLPPRLP